MLLALSMLMMVSGAMVVLAPNGGVFMAGRALIGIVIGGFWSMSAATVMRLVPQEDVPRALCVLNWGNAFATTVAAPLGSSLGQDVGWRGAFFAVVPLAAVTLGWPFISLPPMAVERRDGGGTVFRIMRRPSPSRSRCSVARCVRWASCPLHGGCSAKRRRSGGGPGEARCSRTTPKQAAGAWPP